MGQARYYSTDPRRASVSGYAGASDPLVHPDYTGASPIKPGANNTAVDAAVAHHAEASGENLAQLATISEASLEESWRTRSTVAASRVTMSTRQKPSPFAQRYLSEYAVRYDPSGAKAIKILIRNLPDKFSVSDFFLRGWIGRDPIDPIDPIYPVDSVGSVHMLSVSDSSDSSDSSDEEVRRRRIPPNGHQPLARQNAMAPPKLGRLLPLPPDMMPMEPGMERLGARRRSILYRRTESVFQNIVPGISRAFGLSGIEAAKIRAFSFRP